MNDVTLEIILRVVFGMADGPPSRRTVAKDPRGQATPPRYDLKPDRAGREFAKPRNITLVPSRGARIVVTPR
jgi:hypothetical protein